MAGTPGGGGRVEGAVRVIRAQMADMPGEAMRAIIAESLQGGAQPARTSPSAAHRTMQTVLDRAAARGEPVDAAASDVRIDGAAAVQHSVSATLTRPIRAAFGRFRLAQTEY